MTDFYGDFINDNLNGGNNVLNNIDSYLLSGTGTVVCYLKGSKILTKNGYKTIETLKVGDELVVMGKIENNESYTLFEETTFESVKWIGKFNITGLKDESAPICIKSNAFGENLPFEDLCVSPLHRLLIDGKMVEAFELLNDSTVFRDYSNDSVEYYHVELESHSAILANGVLSESYLDYENRFVFE